MNAPDYKGHTDFPEMVYGHIRSFRDGLTALKLAAIARCDTDDASYWDRELSALRDIELACEAELNR